MIALFLTIFCSASIALLLKLNDQRHGNPVILLASNYVVAALVSFLFLLQNPAATFSGWTLGFGSVLGGSFVLSFFVFSKVVQISGAALATVSARLSVAIPVFLSILLFREIPSSIQLSGFLLTGLAISFFYFSLSRRANENLKRRDLVYILGLFFGIGLNDFSLKLFQQWRPPTEQPFFLLVIFSSAAIYTLAYIQFRKLRFEKNTFLLGGILGVPNIFASFFLLSALADLPALLVYPAANIGTIGLTALGAVIIWREKLNGFGRLALLTGAFAIVLLNF
jgi:drug/metabolite transporter (DMT)-like permease